MDVTYARATVQIIGLTDGIVLAVVRGVLLDDHHRDGLREADAHRVGVQDGQEAHYGQYHSLREYEICEGEDQNQVSDVSGGVCGSSEALINSSSNICRANCVKRF